MADLGDPRRRETHDRRASANGSPRGQQASLLHDASQCRERRVCRVRTAEDQAVQVFRTVLIGPRTVQPARAVTEIVRHRDFVHGQDLSRRLTLAEGNTRSGHGHDARRSDFEQRSALAAKSLATRCATNPSPTSNAMRGSGAGDVSLSRRSSSRLMLPPRRTRQAMMRSLATTTIASRAGIRSKAPSLSGGDTIAGQHSPSVRMCVASRAMQSASQRSGEHCGRASSNSTIGMWNNREQRSTSSANAVPCAVTSNWPSASMSRQICRRAANQ